MFVLRRPERFHCQAAVAQDEGEGSSNRASKARCVVNVAYLSLLS